MKKTLFVALMVVVGLTACGKSTTQSSAGQEAPSTAPGSVNVATWSTGSFGDKMEGTVTNYTRQRSTDWNSFKFPYEGKTYAYFQINDDGHATFEIDRGQIQCSSYNGCSLKIKIDNQKPIYISAAQNNNGKSDYVSICTGTDPGTYYCNGKSFIKSLKGAKKILVEAQVFQEGNPVWEFDVSEFEMPKKAK